MEILRIRKIEVDSFAILSVFSFPVILIRLGIHAILIFIVCRLSICEIIIWATGCCLLSFIAMIDCIELKAFRWLLIIKWINLNSVYYFSQCFLIINWWCFCFLVATTLTLRGSSYVSYRVYDWKDRVHSKVNRISLQFKVNFLYREVIIEK